MPAAQSFKDARTHTFQKLSQHTSPIMAREMEKSILEYTKQSFKNKRKNTSETLKWSDLRVRSLYIQKMRMILNNIQPLLKMVENNQIAVCEVAFQTHVQIKPELWNPIIDAMKQREMLTMLMDNDEDSYQGMLKCNQCSSWNTRYIEFQTRSADEPLTVFMRCVDCGVHETIRG